MLVELMKKSNTYKDKDGKEKVGTSFYIQCGDQVIGIEPVYYGKESNPDRVNSYPREIFGYRSSEELYQDELLKIA